MQDRVNELSKALRLNVIKTLVQLDHMKHNRELTPEHLAFMVLEIDKLPITTRRMAEAFRDAHKMHEDKGMAPHAVSVGDLEWCVNYCAIYVSPSYGWLPKPEDKELRALPEFVELDNIYKGLHKVIAPKESRCDNVAVKMVAEGIRC